MTNTSQFHWHHNEPFALSLANHWLDAHGSCLVRDDGRARLPDGLARGGTASLLLPVKAPTKPGDYILELDVVQEGIAWFADHGSPTLRLEVQVEKEMTPAVDAPSESDRKAPDAPPAPVSFEMNCIPRTAILNLLDDIGCKLEFIEPSGAGGVGTLSYRYYARKRENLPLTFERSA